MPNSPQLHVYSPSFQHAVAFVLAKEGGYVNHPKDPGGETNMGISRRAYPHEDIANLTPLRATFLYHRDYWKAAHCHELPDGTALAVFDAAVQHGYVVAVRLLQEIARVKVDGLFGPITRRAVQQLNPEWFVARYVLRRARLYARIQARNPEQAVFMEGWFNRLRDLTDTCWEVLPGAVHETQRSIA